MTNYRRGYELELAVFHLFDDHGYLAMRSAGSHGIADVIALAPGETLLIQCKTDGKLRPHERTALAATATHLGAHALIAHRDRGIHLHRLTGPGHADRTPWSFRPLPLAPA